MGAAQPAGMCAGEPKMRAGRGKASRPFSQDGKAALGLAAAQGHPIARVCSIIGVHRTAAAVDGGVREVGRGGMPQQHPTQLGSAAGCPVAPSAAAVRMRREEGSGAASQAAAQGWGRGEVPPRDS